jgi:hypothetical protein
MIHVEKTAISYSNLGSVEKGERVPIPKIRQGDVVEGRIIKPIPPHHAILLINGRQLVARTPMLFQAGDLAFFKVEQIVPQCILKLVEVRHDQYNGLGPLLKGADFNGLVYKSLIDLLSPLIKPSEGSGTQKLPDNVKQMWTLLSRISLHPDRTPGPDFLKSFIHGSGMIWEQKLKSLLFLGLQSRSQVQSHVGQDLKGLALGFLGDDRALSLVSTEGASRFVEALEQLQLLNVAGLEEKGKLLLIVPMQWDETFRFAQLLIDLSDKGEGESSKTGGEKVFRVSLFLDMSSLGPVRVDASVFQKDIRICFLVCSDEIQTLISSRTADLRQQLERHGFSVQQVTCRLEERSTLEDTALAESLVDLEEHHISVVI